MDGADTFFPFNATSFVPKNIKTSNTNYLTVNFDNNNPKYICLARLSSLSSANNGFVWIIKDINNNTIISTATSSNLDLIVDKANNQYQVKNTLYSGHVFGLEIY